MKPISLLIFLLPLYFFAQEKGILLSVASANSSDMELSLENGIANVNTTGSDPYLFLEPLKKKLKPGNDQLGFEYFCPTGLDHMEIFFHPLGEKTRSVKVGDIGSTEGWVKFRIDLGQKMDDWGKIGDFLRLDLGAAADLNIQIRNIVLRPKTTREIEIQAQKIEKKREEAILEVDIRKYLDQKFDGEIDQVLVKEDEIVISGKTRENNETFLAEVGIYENATELDNFEFLKPLEIKEGSFRVSLERTVSRHGHKQDRLLSKWMLVEKRDQGYTGISHARYADSIVPKYTYPFVKPSTKKGLGGYSADREAPSSDLKDLGITSVTVNIWINGLFRSKASEDNVAFDYMDKTYYVDEKQLADYDKTMLSAYERNIEVSVILLIAKAAQSPDKTIGNALQHPDTDPAGIYAMPNVITPEGVQYYSAINDFLAQRYSRPDAKYGRIHHYIIHNEVDAGWVWTNAGDKEALVFMDLYHKSMRITYNIARKYNPNSKVFISLTHYWNWTSNPHFYHSRELLEQLLDFSKAEGDFEWAIAQHPYPESLREPKTWLDEKVSFDYDTKLITFKNTEVLDAWVKQPEVLYKGKKRTVYLSENGTNSPTYSEQDLKEQAAGMAYALKKIKYLDGIDGFQYHNWQDNRQEGGLRIGLRRFPDDNEDPGGKKPVWYVYEAFGTDKEDEVFDPYKEIIGITEWEEIRYKGEIGKKKVR